MAVTQVGSTTNAKSAAANSLSCSKPTGVVSGNLLLALVTSNDGAITSSGWTVISGGSGQPDLFNSTWLYKVAGGSEPSSYSFSTSDASSPPMVVTITAWDGVDTVNGPIAGTNRVGGNFPGSGTSSEPLTITGATSIPDALPLYSRACRVGSDSSPGHPMTFTASGVTELTDQGQWSGGTVSYSHAIYLGTEAAGNSPNLAVTASGTKNETDNIVAALTLYALITAVTANAGAASATGTAYNASVAIGPAIGSASATATAGQPVTYASAGLASASASAKAPTVGFGAIPGYASASVAVQSVAHYAHPDCALAVGTADHSQPAAPGGLVTATVAVHMPTLTGTNVGATPGTARAFAEVHPTDLNVPTGAADQTAATVNDAIVGISGSADEVVVTASAYDAQVAVTVNTSNASAAAIGKQPTLTLHSTPGVEGFFVSVNVPQVSVVINGNPAQLTHATGTAYDVTLRSEVVGASSAAATVSQPTMFFGSTRVIKVTAQTRSEVVAPDPGNRVIVVGAK